MAKGEQFIDAVDKDAVPATTTAAEIVIDETPTPAIPDPVPDVDIPDVDKAADAGLDAAASFAERMQDMEELVNSLVDRVTSNANDSGTPTPVNAPSIALVDDDETDDDESEESDPVPWTHRKFFGKGRM